jgi:hypothetical protein
MLEAVKLAKDKVLEHKLGCALLLEERMAVLVVMEVQRQETQLKWPNV